MFTKLAHKSAERRKKVKRQNISKKLALLVVLTMVLSMLPSGFVLAQEEVWAFQPQEAAGAMTINRVQAYGNVITAGLNMNITGMPMTIEEGAHLPFTPYARVFYRVAGTRLYQEGHWFHRYDGNNMATSLFDLTPDTTYDIVIRLYDTKDGTLQDTYTTTVTTKPEYVMEHWVGDPRFTVVTVHDDDELAAALAVAVPGTVIELYVGEPSSYANPHGHHYSGAVLAAGLSGLSGTAELPIVITSASGSLMGRYLQWGSQFDGRQRPDRHALILGPTRIVGANHITIHNVEITNAGLPHLDGMVPARRGHLLVLQACSHITISGSYIHDGNGHSNISIIYDRHEAGNNAPRPRTNNRELHHLIIGNIISDSSDARVQDAQFADFPYEDYDPNWTGTETDLIHHHGPSHSPGRTLVSISHENNAGGFWTIRDNIFYGFVDGIFITERGDPTFFGYNLAQDNHPRWPQAGTNATQRLIAQTLLSADELFLTTLRPYDPYFPNIAWGLHPAGFDGDFLDFWYSQELDIYNNIFYMNTDDGVELNGMNVNTRFFNNRMGQMLTHPLSFSSSYPGPLFVVGNYVSSFSTNAVKHHRGRNTQHFEAVRGLFIYNNTFHMPLNRDNFAWGGAFRLGGGGFQLGNVYMNNIIETGGGIIYDSTSANNGFLGNFTFDYNFLYTRRPADCLDGYPRTFDGNVFAAVMTVPYGFDRAMRGSGLGPDQFDIDWMEYRGLPIPEQGQGRPFMSRFAGPRNDRAGLAGPGTYVDVNPGMVQFIATWECLLEVSPPQHLFPHMVDNQNSLFGRANDNNPLLRRELITSATLGGAWDGFYFGVRPEWDFQRAPSFDRHYFECPSHQSGLLALDIPANSPAVGAGKFIPGISGRNANMGAYGRLNGGVVWFDLYEGPYQFAPGIIRTGGLGNRLYTVDSAVASIADRLRVFTVLDNGDRVTYGQRDGSNVFEAVKARGNVIIEVWPTATRTPTGEIATAFYALRPGDTVYFHEGTYGRLPWVWPGGNDHSPALAAINNPTMSGTAGNLITISGYPGGERPLLYEGGSGPLLWVRGSFLNINGFEFRKPAGSMNHMLRVGHGGGTPTNRFLMQHVSITNNHFGSNSATNSGGQPLAINAGSTNADLYNILVENNVFIGGRASNIYIGNHNGLGRGRDVIIRGNFLCGALMPRPCVHGGQSAFGIQIKRGITGVIEENIFVNFRGPGIMVHGSYANQMGDWPLEAIVRNNITVGNKNLGGCFWQQPHHSWTDPTYYMLDWFWYEGPGIYVGGGVTQVYNNIALANGSGGVKIEAFWIRRPGDAPGATDNLFNNISVRNNTTGLNRAPFRDFADYSDAVYLPGTTTRWDDTEVRRRTNNTTQADLNIFVEDNIYHCATETSARLDGYILQIRNLNGMPDTADAFFAAIKANPGPYSEAELIAKLGILFPTATDLDLAQNVIRGFVSPNWPVQAWPSITQEWITDAETTVATALAQMQDNIDSVIYGLDVTATVTWATPPILTAAGLASQPHVFNVALAEGAANANIQTSVVYVEFGAAPPVPGFSIFNNGPGGTQYPRPNPGLAAAGTIRMWTQLDGIGAPVYLDAADTIVALDQDGNCAMEFVRVSRVWVDGQGWADYFNLLDVNKNGDWEYINLSITVFRQTVNVLLVNALFEAPVLPVFSWDIFNNGPGGTQYPRPNPSLAAAGTIRMWTQLDGVNAPVYLAAEDTIVALDQDGDCAMQFVRVNRVWVAGTGWANYFANVDVNKNGNWQYINLYITVYGQTVHVLLVNALFEMPATDVTVTFVVEAGAVGVYAATTTTVVVPAGEAIPASAIPNTNARTGFYFAGWYPIDPAGFVVTEDTTFTARFNPLFHYVTFEAGHGGELEPAAGFGLVVSIRDGFTFWPDRVPTPVANAGYEFVEWYPTNPAGFVVRDSTTFTAVFAPV